MSKVNLIVFLDLAASLGSAAVLILLAAGWKRALRADAKVILAVLFGMIFFHDLGNVLEYSGITNVLDPYGDYLKIVTAIVWGVFFYACLQSVIDREVRESKERFRALVETTSDWIWETDAVGRFTYVSPHVQEVLGYRPEEILGKTIIDLLAPGDRERMTRTFAEITAGRQPFTQEEELLCKDGRAVFHDARGTPYFDQGGVFCGFRGMARDVTARKRAEEELARQNEQLRKLDKIKDDLLRDVTHELKTPVAKMAMQLELLKAALKEGSSDGTARILEIMGSSIKRQEEAIRNILDLSRLEGDGRRYTLEFFPLHGLLAQLREEYRHDCQTHDVTLTSTLEEITVKADREMLWHVFSNLLSNAIKFRRKTGRPAIRLSLERKGERALVTVQDNGIGLGEEDRQRAFERFYKGQNSVEGTGIGLTISRRIVEDLGGFIWIESPGPAQGTTVRVLL